MEHGHAPRTIWKNFNFVRGVWLRSAHFLNRKFRNFLWCALIAELIAYSESAQNFDIGGVSASQKKSKIVFGRYFRPNLGLILPDA